MKVQHTATLDFTDNGTFETGWRIKQGDYGNTELVLKLVNNGVNVYDAEITPQIAFRRWDGASVISVMTPNDQTYKYAFAGNELEVPGLTLCDVKFTDAEGRVSTASCRFTVVEDTIGYDPTGAHTYDNPVSELVEQATNAAEVGIESSFKAEGFAVGEQGGVPVGPDSPYYHNNAKYYGEMPARSISYYEQNGFLSRNLLNTQYYLGYIDKNTGAFVPSGGNFSTDYVKVKPSTTYTFSVDKTSELRASEYSSNSTSGHIQRTSESNTKSYTFTTTANTNYLRLTVINANITSVSDVDNYKPKLEIGSVSHEYMPYAPSNNALNSKKSDITAIGTDESGRTTASRAYAYGERFYKDGKFCRSKATDGVAQGATWTLGTNYTEEDIASSFEEYVKSNSSGVASVQAKTNEWMIVFSNGGLYTLLVTTAFQYHALNKIFEASGISASYDTSTGILSISGIGNNRNVLVKRIPFSF